MDTKLIEKRKIELQESLNFFSNKLKPERELWVCNEFLKNIGISFVDSELVPVEDDPPDIIFRTARFEVKELLDKGRRRTKEYQETLKKAETATDVTDLLKQYTPRTISVEDAAICAVTEVEQLSNKYPLSVRQSLDLIYYVNFIGYAVIGKSISTTIVTSTAKEWCSISYVSNNCSCVIWASDSAPDFIKPIVDRVIQKYL